MTDVVYDKNVVARCRYVHVHCKTILGRTVEREDEMTVWYITIVVLLSMSGFYCCNMLLSDYFLTSLTCEKSASSLTPPVSCGGSAGGKRYGPSWAFRMNSLELMTSPV